MACYSSNIDKCVDNSGLGGGFDLAVILISVLIIQGLEEGLT